MKETVAIYVRLDPETAAAFKALSEMQGRTTHGMAKWMVAKAVAKAEKRAKRAAPKC